MGLRIINHSGIAEVFADIEEAIESGDYTPAENDVIYITGEQVSYKYIDAAWEVLGSGGSASYDGNPTTITQNSTHRFATDVEKDAWNAKADALGTDDNYVTDAEKTTLANLSGTNTGDQDLSGKQDRLISATNIKTVNGSSLLGSGDLTVGGLTQQQIEGLI